MVQQGFVLLGADPLFRLCTEKTKRKATKTKTKVLGEISRWTFWHPQFGRFSVQAIIFQFCVIWASETVFGTLFSLVYS